MKDLELRTITKNLPMIARVRIAPSTHAFHVEGRKWEAINAIFKQLGIELCPGQEDYINSCFVLKAGVTPKRTAVVRACSGDYKEYSLFLMNNILGIAPRITEFFVKEIGEFNP